MDGDGGDGWDDGETQALEDGGTPPVGSPFSGSDAMDSEDDDGAHCGDTQVVHDAEAEGDTQIVDDGFFEEGVVGGWEETQVVEDSEEEADGVGAHEQEQAQVVAECEEEQDGDGMEDNAGDLGKDQLVEECEVQDGGNAGVDDGLETQLMEEYLEDDERVNDSGDDDVGDWGKTQLVEDSDELSEGTQVLSDSESEGQPDDKRDLKLDMEGSNGKVNGAEHGDMKNLVNSDASTDEEGDTVRTCELAAASEAIAMNSVQQGKQQVLRNKVHLMTNIIGNSNFTSCRTSFGDHSDCVVDNDSHGYAQNHDKDGTKSRGRCSTAKKLFADMMAEEDEDNSRCFAGLSYVESQEPGDLSQANALELVDRLISINGGVSSQESTPQKIETAKRPVSSKRGTLKLVEKVDHHKRSNGRAEIFAWVDNREDDGGGDFFSKNKDILLHKSTNRGKSKSHFPRERKRTMKIAPAGNKMEECETRINSKLCVGFETVSGSRLLRNDVKSKQASVKKTKKNLLKDLDNQFNPSSLEGQEEKVAVASHDVGPDTQMALEAMEVLAQCSPAKHLSAEGGSPSDREMRDKKHKLAKSHSKNFPQMGGIQEGVTTRSKRRKTTESNPKPQKERHREHSKDLRTMEKYKEAKSVTDNNKVPRKIIDGSKYDNTPVAHRTRNCSKNSLTGDNSKVKRVQNNHLSNGPVQLMVSEKTTESGSNYVEKEITEHACANSAHDLLQYRVGRTQHNSANVAQNLEQYRGEPSTDVMFRKPSSHPKQRRTPTAIIQSKAPAVTRTATDSEITPEMARPSKKRRIFIRSVSELLKYAKRGPSSSRSTSLLSSIIAKSSAASSLLNSSVRASNKCSYVASPGQRQKHPSNVDDASKSPENNSQVQNSALKTPFKTVNELSPTFSPLNPSKASSRSLSKPSVARELLKVDHENVPLDRPYKDFRRRKDMTNSSILFSHHLDQDVIKRQKKILERLGVREAFSMLDATHFVADSFFRTKNMLEAIALGKLVVTSMWLENCAQAGCFVDEKKYVLRDAKKEKEIGFSMPISLASACKHPLLLGKRVLVTANVKPSQEVMTSLVSASSGQPLERIGRSIVKEKEMPDDLLIIACEDDYATVEPLLERGASVFDPELVLNGIIIQKLEYERHRLFSDCIKQTRSTRWLKDAPHGRFVPVSKGS